MSAQVGLNGRRQNKEISAAILAPRLTFEERAALDAAAGDQPLGRYIRAQMLGDMAAKRKPYGKAPVKDQRALGRVLAELGQARLANNLNQLAKAVNSGSLPVTPETEDYLRAACQDVRQIRADLVGALGLIEGQER